MHVQRKHLTHFIDEVVVSSRKPPVLRIVSDTEHPSLESTVSLSEPAAARDLAPRRSSFRLVAIAGALSTAGLNNPATRITADVAERSLVRTF